ncbi:hypothetical protein D9M69_696570 [compost metagenome]
MHDEHQNYEHGYSLAERQQFVGELTGVMRHGLAEVRVKNHFAVGDRLQLMTPKGNLDFRLEALQTRYGERQTIAPGDGHVLYLPVPTDLPLENALLLRWFSTGNSRTAVSA